MPPGVQENSLSCKEVVHASDSTARRSIPLPVGPRNSSTTNSPLTHSRQLSGFMLLDWFVAQFDDKITQSLLPILQKCRGQSRTLLPRSNILCMPEIVSCRNGSIESERARSHSPDFSDSSLGDTQKCLVCSLRYCVDSLPVQH